MDAYILIRNSREGEGTKYLLEPQILLFRTCPGVLDSESSSAELECAAAVLLLSLCSRSNFFPVLFELCLWFLLV
jgi:hypothetical protein